METLKISISKSDKEKFGIIKNDLTFLELMNIVKNQRMRENLRKCVKIAEKHGLSSMSLNEINEEIKTVRTLKNHS